MIGRRSASPTGNNPAGCTPGFFCAAMVWAIGPSAPDRPVDHEISVGQPPIWAVPGILDQLGPTRQKSVNIKDFAPVEGPAGDTAGSL